MSRTRWFLPLTTFLLTAAGAGFAQQPIDLEKMATMMRQNQEELRSYSWDTRVVFLIDGNQRRSDTFQVRYVMGGMVEKMQIDSEVAPGAIRGPDGKKLTKKELEAAREFALSVKDQLDGYLNPMFAEKAIATASVSEQNGNLILKSSNVVTSGDTVVITVHRATETPLAAAVTTVVDSAPVRLDVSFAAMEYGPNYPVKSITTSEWHGIKLTIVTENSGYELSRN